MNSKWFKHVKDPKEKEKLLGALKASVTMRDLLQKLLEEELTEMASKSSQEKDFEDPSWAYKQAFRNGKIAHIRSLLDLIDFNKG